MKFWQNAKEWKVFGFARDAIHEAYTSEQMASESVITGCVIMGMWGSVGEGREEGWRERCDWE